MQNRLGKPTDCIQVMLRWMGEWKLELGLFVISSFACISVAYGIQIWHSKIQLGPEAVATFRQSRGYLLGQFSPVGLKNSQGFYNPNALPLTILPLTACAATIESMPGLLAAASVILILASTVTIASSLSRHWQLGVLSAVISLPWTMLTPLLLHTCCDIWGQHVARTLLCTYTGIAAANLTAALQKGLGANVSLAAMGFLTIWIPAVHLAMVVAVPAMLVVNLLLLRRSRFSGLTYFGLGLFTAFILTWYPWLQAFAIRSPQPSSVRMGQLDARSLLAGFGLREMGIAIRAFHEGATIESEVPFTRKTEFWEELKLAGRLRFLIFCITAVALLAHAYRHVGQQRIVCFWICIVTSPFTACTLLGYRSRIDYLIQLATPVLVLVIPGGFVLLLSQQPTSRRPNLGRIALIAVLLLASFSQGLVNLSLSDRIAKKYRYSMPTNFPSVEEVKLCAVQLFRLQKAPFVIACLTENDRFEWLDAIYTEDNHVPYSKYGLLEEVFASRGDCRFVKFGDTFEKVDFILVVSPDKSKFHIDGMAKAFQSENIVVYRVPKKSRSLASLGIFNAK